jgi:hypothetical protein
MFYFMYNGHVVLWHSLISVDKKLCEKRRGAVQMYRTKYAAEFKSEAVKYFIDKGHAAVDVAKRL